MFFFFFKCSRTAIYVIKRSENVLHTTIYGYIRDPATFVLKGSTNTWHFGIRSVCKAKTWYNILKHRRNVFNTYTYVIGNIPGGHLRITTHHLRLPTSSYVLLCFILRFITFQ